MFETRWPNCMFREHDLGNSGHTMFQTKNWPNFGVIDSTCRSAVRQKDTMEVTMFETRWPKSRQQRPSASGNFHSMVRDSTCRSAVRQKDTMEVTMCETRWPKSRQQRPSASGNFHSMVRKRTTQTEAEKMYLNKNPKRSLLCHTTMVGV
jgi:hypothetical protein